MSKTSAKTKGKTEDLPTFRRKLTLLAPAILFALVILICLVPFVTNPFTPAGHVGYIFEEPRLFGSGGFQGTTTGPGTFGGSLRRLRVTNIDVTPQSHTGTIFLTTEEGPVRCEWEAVVHPLPDKIRSIVENFGGHQWYQRHAAPLLTESLRDSITNKAEPVSGYEMIESLAIRDFEARISSINLPVALDHLTIRTLEMPQQNVVVETIPDEPDPIDPPDEKNASSDDAVLVEVSHRREFRGMWLATISNVDWPSREGLPMEQQKEEFIAYLDQLEAMNMNALVFQVRPSCDAFYRSEKEPWSSWLTGNQGEDPGYDPLEFAIEECRKRSIELHAWFNPFRAKPAEKVTLAENHFMTKNPEMCVPYAGMSWMDPGVKEVRDWVIDVIIDVVERYDIAGVHLDDYFYPYPIKGATFDDDASYQAYLTEWGHMEKQDWRRQNIDSLISRLAKRIRTTKPHVKFGVSPFGLYRPGEPHGTRGLDQFETISSNPKKWLEQGWVDYITPQLYWRESSNLSYSKLLEWWGETNSLRRHIYAGNSLISIERNRGNWPFSEFKTQLDASREALDQQSLGNIFFGTRVLGGKNGAKVQAQFTNSLYPTPTLPPAMPWLSDRAPERPRNVASRDAEIRWDTRTDSSIKLWALYKRDSEDGTWALADILPATSNRVDATPGRYALSSVDRLMQESVGVLVDVAEPQPSAADEARAEKPDVAESAESDNPES